MCINEKTRKIKNVCLIKKCRKTTYEILLNNETLGLPMRVCGNEETQGKIDVQGERKYF